MTKKTMASSSSSFNSFQRVPSSSAEPFEISLARNKVQTQITNIEEAVQTSSLRGTQEAQLVGMVKDMMTLVSDVERAWRINVEESKAESASSAATVTGLRDQIERLRQELVSTEVKLQKSEADVRQLTKDLTAANRDTDERITRALLAKTAELESWKDQYTGQMRDYVNKKMSETREQVQKLQATGLEAGMARVEQEYKERAEMSTKALTTAKQSELNAKRDAAEAIRRADAAESRVAILLAENNAFRDALSKADARTVEIGEGGRHLASEVVRLQRTLDAERKAHVEMNKLAESKHRHELEAIAASRAGALASAFDGHQAELERLKKIHDVSIRSREDLVNSWRAKYAAAAARAESAEQLLREIDRQLVPAGGDTGE